MTFNPEEFVSTIESNIDKAMSVGGVGDKVLMVLSGNSEPWFTGDNQAQSVSMVVPSDDDFYAESINIYLAARDVDQSSLNGNASELTFRPAMWVTTENGTDDYGYYYAQDANATWKLSDTYNGTYQGETGMKISSAYSSRYGQGAVYSEMPLSAWPASRKLFMPYKLRRGSTATVSISPTFSRTVNATIKAQFRVSVVLMGYKVVRRAA
jgi:hypothetical protein